MKIMDAELLPLPVPLDPILEDVEEKRLWIGNLDQRLTEYQLLKILQPYGTIVKFDLLFHQSGPLKGQPRGYAFVTFEKREDAINAKDKLNGLKLGTRHVSVKWAHSINLNEKEKTKVLPEISGLAGAKNKTVTNKAATIQAIEAKLRLMQNTSTSDLDFSERPMLVSQPAAASQAKELNESNKGPHHSRKRPLPYTRHKRY